MRLTREKVCNLCYACKHKCKQVDNISKCVNFTQGYTPTEYREIIKEQNINIEKLCDKYGLKRNYMYKMLSGKITMDYKYAYYLDTAIHEKTEYVKYYKKFEVSNG